MYSIVKGASQGEGLGNQFLGHIKQNDAIVHVVRCFDDPNVIHVVGSKLIHYVTWILLILELMLADYDTAEKN